MKYLFGKKQFKITEVLGNRSCIVKAYNTDYNLKMQDIRIVDGCRLFIFTGMSDRQTAVPEIPSFNNLICSSPSFLSTVNQCKKNVNPGRICFLNGEIGTGKETLARCIHNDSPIANAPFFCIHNNTEFDNFFTLSRTTTTSIHYCTIYIEEFANFNHYNQDRLCELLRTCIANDYKVICASSANLDSLIMKEELHRDLYYILLSEEITVPPLRDRKEDIPLFVNKYLAALNKKLNRSITIHQDVLNSLTQYSWPGNLHQLENLMIKAIYSIESIDGVIDMKLARELPHSTPYAGGSYSLASAERSLVQRVLSQYSGIKGAKALAAEALGISQATLYRKIKEYNL
ncbi:MAG: sigma 54-interacting transcriptional regulator [Clostridia bacterium]|nr:sigma 54-interacting transcriptional regulator [Clostridia bacterium]